MGNHNPVVSEVIRIVVLYRKRQESDTQSNFNRIVYNCSVTVTTLFMNFAYNTWIGVTRFRLLVGIPDGCWGYDSSIRIYPLPAFTRGVQLLNVLAYMIVYIIFL